MAPRQIRRPDRTASNAPRFAAERRQRCRAPTLATVLAAAFLAGCATTTAPPSPSADSVRREQDETTALGLSDATATTHAAERSGLPHPARQRGFLRATCGVPHGHLLRLRRQHAPSVAPGGGPAVLDVRRVAHGAVRDAQLAGASRRASRRRRDPVRRRPAPTHFARPQTHQSHAR